MDEKVRLAKLEERIDGHFQTQNIQIEQMADKITTIFQLLNDKVMPEIHAVPFLVKGFWVMATAIVGMAVWLVQGAIGK